MAISMAWWPQLPRSASVEAGTAVGEHVFAEGGVDAALVAFAGAFEKCQDFGVEAQGDLLLVLFGYEVHYWLGDTTPAGAALRGNIAVVDVFVSQVFQAIPRLLLVCGQRWRIVGIKTVGDHSSRFVAHDDLPF